MRCCAGIETESKARKRTQLSLHYSGLPSLTGQSTNTVPYSIYHKVCVCVCVIYKPLFQIVVVGYWGMLAMDRGLLYDERALAVMKYIPPTLNHCWVSSNRRKNRNLFKISLSLSLSPAHWGRCCNLRGSVAGCKPASFPSHCTHHFTPARQCLHHRVRQR